MDKKREKGRVHKKNDVVLKEDNSMDDELEIELQSDENSDGDEDLEEEHLEEEDIFEVSGDEEDGCTFDYHTCKYLFQAQAT